MGQILLFLVIYHLVGAAAALLIENYLNDMARWKKIMARRPRLAIALSLSAAFLAGCETPAIKVGAMPDVAAVRIQNETTKKQIKTFSDHNKKTRGQIKKSQDAGVKEVEKLQAARKMLEGLLESK